MNRIIVIMAVIVPAILYGSLAEAAPAASKNYIAVDPASGNVSCPMSETANVTVNFKGTQADVSTIKNTVDAKIGEIKQLGKAAGLSKFEMQSMNYNVNARTSAEDYRYSGNISFTVLPVSKASDFMTALTQKGYQVNLNVNSYRDCNSSQEGGKQLD